MRLEYDLDVRALYIRLGDAEVVRTQEAGSNAAVDLDASGAVVGIEVLSVDYPWPVADILGDYPISATDEAEIRAYFCLPDGAASPGQRYPLTSPEMSVGRPAPALAPA